jgi:hypothetical protein
MMESHEPTDDAQKRAVEEAKSALRANLDAGFQNLAPHLRLLLENLPILQPGTPVLHAYPPDKAAESDAKGTMDFLRREWIETKVTDYETIGLSSIADEPALLGITFHGNIWSAGYMETRLTVARITEDRFRFWRYHENGGVWGSAPGEYQKPSLGSPAPRGHASALTGKRVGASKPGLFARIREWFKRHSK